MRVADIPDAPEDDWRIQSGGKPAALQTLREARQALGDCASAWSAVALAPLFGVRVADIPDAPEDDWRIQSGGKPAALQTLREARQALGDCASAWSAVALAPLFGVRVADIPDAPEDDWRIQSGGKPAALQTLREARQALGDCASAWSAVALAPLFGVRAADIPDAPE